MPDFEIPLETQRGSNGQGTGYSQKMGFSPLELQQQAKFAMKSSFLHRIKNLLNETFKPESSHLTGYNKAFSYNIKNVFTGTHPDLSIDYSMVLLSREDLPNAGSPQAASTTVGKLEFSWMDNSGKGKALGADKVFVAVYCEEKKDWKYGKQLSARSDGRCTLETPQFSGKSVHSYIGFMSENGKEVTDSIYTGLVIEQ